VAGGRGGAVTGNRVGAQDRGSERLFAEAVKLLAGGVNSRCGRSEAWADPALHGAGEGAWLEDVDGNRYVDLVLSWGPLILGHAHPAVLAAIARPRRGGPRSALPPSSSAAGRAGDRDLPSVEMVRFVSSAPRRHERGPLARPPPAPRADQVRRLLPRPRGALLAAAGSGVATLGCPTRRGDPEHRGRTRWWCRTTTLPRSRRSSRPGARRSPASWWSRSPATWGWCRRLRSSSTACARSPAVTARCSSSTR
jgi:hypothetical protein